MFRSLINDVKSAAVSLVAKYVVRASVAVPFIAALGFATAAVTVMLVDRYGAAPAYWMVAAGFTTIGLIATLVVTMKEQEEQVADTQAEKTDTAQVANAAVKQAATQAPLALLGALLTTPLGPTALAGGANALAGGAKMFARNIPLVVLLAAFAFLAWPAAASGTPDTDAAAPDSPDDEDIKMSPPSRDPTANGLHREAA